MKFYYLETFRTYYFDWLFVAFSLYLEILKRGGPLWVGANTLRKGTCFVYQHNVKDFDPYFT